jgi:4-coumarate--CoA ligase
VSADLLLARLLTEQSRTTGLPKGVCISHYNVVSNVAQIKSLYDFSPSERWAGFLPLYHAYGQCYGILMATVLHIPMLIISAFNFRDYLQIIQTHKIKRLQTVPPIMIMFSKRPETAEFDLSSVKEMLCGAAPLSKELQATVSKKFNVRITQGWGMTETTCAATGVPYYEEHRTGSVGVVMPNTEVKMIMEDGREAPVGERGELYVRGPQVALGYWRNPEATRETFGAHDGWLITGDVAVIDEEGFMFIVDRKKV